MIAEKAADMILKSWTAPAPPLPPIITTPTPAVSQEFEEIDVKGPPSSSNVRPPASPPSGPIFPAQPQPALPPPPADAGPTGRPVFPETRTPPAAVTDEPVPSVVATTEEDSEEDPEEEEGGESDDERKKKIRKTETKLNA